MAALITLQQAKTQLRIAYGSDDYDEDLTLKMEQATAIVIDYIKRPDHGWDAGSPTTVSPADNDFPIVQAAILEVLTNLFSNRGDSDTSGPITPRIESMLRRLRDPALA